MAAMISPQVIPAGISGIWAAGSGGESISRMAGLAMIAAQSAERSAKGARSCNEGSGMGVSRTNYDDRGPRDQDGFGGSTAGANGELTGAGVPFGEEDPF